MKRDDVIERHWAEKYVGRSYEEVGRCWGLVRMVCAERFGVEMPIIKVGSPEDQSKAIREASACIGWRRVQGALPAGDDIVVMRGVHGPHIGFAIRVDGIIGVLHAKGAVTSAGAVGSVVFDLWPDLAGSGFHSFEFWRRGAR